MNLWWVLRILKPSSKIEVGKQLLKIGLLALQGAFELHESVLLQVGLNKNIEVEPIQVRSPKDLEDIDAIILPGGESTVISRLLNSSGLFNPLQDLFTKNMPVMATCAGLILLSNEFGILDCKVERNAYGKQIDSFEAKVFSVADGKYYAGSFIRAPKIINVGNSVEITAKLDEEIVGIKQGNIWAYTFHPEVLNSTYFHELFLESIN